MSLDDMHDDVQTALAGEALDALSGPERERVLAHVADCPQCAADLAALRDAAGALAWLPPPRPMDADRSARLRARLVARAAVDGAGRTLSGTTPAAAPAGAVLGPALVRQPPDAENPPAIAPEPVRHPAAAAPTSTAISSIARPGRAPWLALAASLAGLLAVGAYAAHLNGRVHRLEDAIAAGDQRTTALQQGMAERDSALAGLTSARVKVIDLAATGGRAPGGRMFWNPGTDAWNFYAHDLPALPAGREYELWLITPGRKIPAGTFVPGAGGHARVEARYALPADSLRAIAVTVEPTGGLPKPSGPIVIVGAVTTE